MFFQRRSLHLALLVCLYFFVASLGNAVAQSVNAADVSPETRRAVEEKVDRYVHGLSDPFNGTILLAIGDSILLNKGYGLADRSHGVPNSAETKYEIASTTKHFTAVLTLQLVEKGLLDLDSTIDRYLPEYPKDKASKITIHQLLLHQSGIPHHITGIENYLDVQTRLFHTPLEYVKLFGGSPLAHEPGRGWTYSSPGYFLLAMILERVSGKSYSELLAENITRPLGMKNTFVGNNLTIRENMAIGYMKGLDGLVTSSVEEMSNRLGAGDLISTSGDLYLFQRALDPNGSCILSKKSSELLFKQFIDFGRVGMAYIGGLAHVNEFGRDVTTVGIGEGSSFGFRSRMTRLLELDASYVVLSNIQGDEAMTQEMYNYLTDILLERLGKPMPAASVTRRLVPQGRTPASTADYEKYAGIYRKGDNTFVLIDVLDGHVSQQTIEGWNGIYFVRGGALEPIDNNVFASSGRENVEYRFSSLSVDGARTLKFFRDGRPDGEAVSVASAAGPELIEYCGNYYSLERQVTYRLSCEHDVLKFVGLQDGRETKFKMAKKDLFASGIGFLVFHRYSDGKIRDFRFRSKNVDPFAAGVFIRK